DFVLDVGRAQAADGERSPSVQFAASPRGTIPPPPPRDGAYRAPRIIEAQAFATRPVLVKLEPLKPEHRDGGGQPGQDASSAAAHVDAAPAMPRAGVGDDELSRSPSLVLAMADPH